MSDDKYAINTHKQVKKLPQAYLTRHYSLCFTENEIFAS